MIYGRSVLQTFKCLTVFCNRWWYKVEGKDYILQIIYFGLCMYAYLKFNSVLRGSGVRLYDGPDLKLFILVGWGRSFLSVAWPTGVQLIFFFCSGVSKLFGAQ